MCGRAPSHLKRACAYASHAFACMHAVCVCVWGWPTISERERYIYREDMRWMAKIWMLNKGFGWEGCFERALASNR